MPLAAGLRWWLLLRSQGTAISLGQAISLTWTGLLFTLLPGGLVSGDAVKAVMVAQVTSKRPAAVLSVYVDRALGLLSMLVVAVAAGLLSWNTVAQLPDWVIGVLLTGAAGLAAGLVGLALVLSRHFGRNFIVRRLEAAARGESRAAALYRVLYRLVESIAAYREHKRTVALVLLVSVAAQSVVIFAGVMLGHALAVTFPALEPLSQAGETALYFLALPVGMVVQAVPLTPGGFGQLEWALEEIFEAFGSDKGFTLALLWHFIAYFMFLFGIPFYLMRRKKK